jgi:hypothetical protein
MTSPTDMNDLRLAWRALSGSDENEGWKTIPVATSAPCLLRAGRHLPQDEEALLVGFRNVLAPPESHLPQGHGFKVSLLSPDPTGSDVIWLALARRLGGSLDLFALMAEDLLRFVEESRASNEEQLLHQFLWRIRAWQDFMDHHREGVLSPEAELGIFGELTIIDGMLTAGMPERLAVESWQGPLGGLQDLMPGPGGIEVKTTLSPASFLATISSLEQLDDHLRQPIFLAAVRLTLDSSGKTLPAKAEEIRERLESNQAALGLFDVRLIQAGLLRTMAERYTRRFLPISYVVFPVQETFPRLTRAQVHPAIRKVRYEIDLDLAGGSDIGLVRALQLLGAI